MGERGFLPSEEGQGVGGEGGRAGEGGQLRATVPGEAAVPMTARATKHRAAQMARRPKRKLFDKAAKEDFLGWYAASGNCVWAAAKAGFDDGTVWRHRLADAEFREAFDLAAAQGLQRSRVTMLEQKMNAKGYEIDGGREMPPFEVDPEIALRLIATHDRACAGGGPRVRQQGRRPRIATNAEIEAALAKRLRAFQARVKAGAVGLD